MESNEEKIEQRKKAIKEKLNLWLKDKALLFLAGIIILAIVLRLYFLAVAKDQAHWWDSLAFGSLAKNMIYHYWDNNAFLIHEGIIRPPLLSLLWSWLLRLNFSDLITIFLLEIIPSVLSVIFIYLLAKELYNKKVAIISSFIFAVLWIHLFYSVRIMSDAPSLFFSIASIYFFAKSYEEIKFKPFTLSIFFISLAILTRFYFGLIGIIYIFFMIFTHRTKLIKSKNFWLGGIIGSLPIAIYFISNLMTQGSLLPALKVYAESAATKPAFAFYTLSFIYYVLGAILTLFFLIGTIIVISQLLLGFDRIGGFKKLKSNMLMIVCLIIPLAFFIFWLRAAEDRYLFLCMPSILILSAIGIASCYEFVRKYSKYIAVILIAALLLFSAYKQITFASELIENKKTSYSQMRDAFVWINENTEKDAVLLGDGIEPYAIYYGERKLTNWSQDTIKEDVMNADYVILHGFEHQTKELLDYVQNGSAGNVSPVQAFFFDSEKKQPAVIIYKVGE